ncbi:DUF3888 domain-containing protein (plasmid) [Clostridium estertheticum]|uniref:DUF3888 domain-containing protein n=2 Tax=Clostridium estertheticum TaxID=238834 RepID=UPI002714A25A|nr:DUF3888 domain-containing protein [Clostridium estertheticum]WLC77741.1 DUF3888 domain-containing protein [Clostridium estertheticum]
MIYIKKKILFLVMTLFLSLSFSITSYASVSSIPLKNSTEELYQDIFSTLLDENIQDGLHSYYKKFVQYDLFDIKVLKAIRPAGYRTFGFLLKLQVRPFVGAHNTIGIDNITFEISPSGVIMKNFEHLKSFELPPYLR